MAGKTADPADANAFRPPIRRGSGKHGPRLDPGLFGLIAAQIVLERASPTGLSVWQHEFFAWTDLAVCSVFLFEFALKLALVPNRMTYFVRHFVIDLVASLPFGFVFTRLLWNNWRAALGRAATGRSGLSSVGRAGVSGSSGGPADPPAGAITSDPVKAFTIAWYGEWRAAQSQHRLVRALANAKVGVERSPSSSDLRSELEHAKTALQARLDRDQRRQVADASSGRLEGRIDACRTGEIDEAADENHRARDPRREGRRALDPDDPERLIGRAGPAFVTAVDRYLRLLDLPLIRRLPIIRNLVAYREKSPAEAVALAANYLGHLIQRGLNVVYFFADLQGTLSPPVFLDRLGATLVNATRTPAKRLLWLGSASSSSS